MPRRIKEATLFLLVLVFNKGIMGIIHFPKIFDTPQLTQLLGEYLYSVV